MVAGQPTGTRWPAADGCLRLIIDTNRDCKGAIPLNQEILEHLLEDWGMLRLETPWIPLYAGGSTLPFTEPRNHRKIDFPLGGTRYKRSISGLFSYDCQSNITTDVVISGSNIPYWADELPGLFAQVPHPMTVVVAMAEALMEIVLDMTRQYRDRVKNVEGMTQRAVEPDAMLQDYRALAIELGLINWHGAKVKIGFERSLFQFNFIRRYLESPTSPFSPQCCGSKLDAATKTLLSRTNFALASLEILNFEHDMNKTRLETQNQIAANLIAQQDVSVSLKMAEDSKKIAVASRRDSSIMHSIAVLGIVFLPATFAATFLAMLLMYNSDPEVEGVFSSRIWIYFAVTVPITVATVTAMLYWIQHADQKHPISRKSVEIRNRTSDMDSPDHAGEHV